jgi:ketopantoate hydroxymethyltransferase
VLVINDVLGFSPGKAPKFAKPRLDLKSLVRAAAAEYVQETKGEAAPKTELSQ